MSSGEGDRRFEATEHRREQFRKEGRFARSRDASAVAATAGVVGVLVGSRAAIGVAIGNLFRCTHGNLTALTRGQPIDVLRLAYGTWLAIAGPAVVAAAVAAAAVGLAQVGFRVNLESVGFKAERLDPVSRMKQLLSPRQASIEIALSLLRVVVVGYVAYRTSSAELGELTALARTTVDDSAPRIADAVLHVVLGAGGALAAIAIIDYAQSRFRLEQEMKMTRQELTEEMRQQDGDPRVKGRIRARARALAKKRALKNVKKAHVVVTNPTHVAVALRYDDKDPAPIVVAKGHDDEALRIRAEARKYGIPILENRPLARALDAEVPIGHSIPLAHFAAVARVLAFVYRLRGTRRRGTRRA